jgi:hypothetical protein
LGNLVQVHISYRKALLGKDCLEGNLLAERIQ